jgi:PAS domain S-box-containing protein
VTSVGRQNLERRLVFLAPTSKDVALTAAILERAGVPSAACSSLKQTCQELEAGAGAVLLPEEALLPDEAKTLVEWLARQPSWSDLPVLVTAGPGAASPAISLAMEQLGNVTVLERPIRIAALVSAVRTALRARQRQYQIRDQLAEREQSLRAKGLLAAIVASSDDAIISKTLDGNILTWNASAERLFGYSAAEAIGQPITLLIPPERLQEEADILRRLRRGERIDHLETVRVTKDGRRIDVSLTVSPLVDERGKVIGASKVARDVTERKKVDDALRAAQEQLQVVTDHMAVVVTRCSRDLRYLWVSRGAAAWFGQPADDIIGRSIPEFLGSDAFETIRPYVECVLRGERVEFETLVPYASLGPRWVRAVYTPTSDESGQIDGWVAVITDTTEHHRLEEALREADRRKDEFLAVLAHELRNPLAPIRNSLDILRLTSRHDSTGQPFADMMERQVSHMVRLVDDLLEVSRITRGKVELRKELVPIATVVRSAVEASLPLIEGAGHKFSLTIPSDPLIVDGDPVRLAQVVSNLLNNAAKYTDPRGQISLAVLREDDSVVISVSDTGSGISADMLPGIFELFTQAHRDRTQGGLGIGLTLVRSLVEQHGGTVTAKSEGLGRGSEFTVRLPLLSAHRSAADPRPRPAPSGAVIPHRVLVVDDNADAAESLRMLLELLGAEVHVAHTGPAALEAVSIHKPAAVILDIGIPGMSGYEVAQRIRAHPDFGEVRLIALTGWGQDDDRRRSLMAGFDYHLVKPADVATLQAVLSSVDVPSSRKRRALSDGPGVVASQRTS